MQLQGRTDHDHGTTGIIDTLAQQVLPEATLLALDHVGQGLQWQLVGTGDGTTATTVVEQRIDCFLQHALLVADDDVGCVEIQQTLQAVVAVDHPPIEIVQIRGRKTATVERHQRAQFRRQYRQHLHHHPLGTVTGMQEGLHQLQALGELLDLGFGVGLRQLFADGLDLVREVDRLQQFIDRFGAHARIEVIAILFYRVEVGLFREQLAALEIGHTRLDHHVGLEIEDALNLAQGHVEQQSHARRQRLQIPDVRDRACQLDMAHTLTTDFGECHFDAALLAHHAAVF